MLEDADREAVDGACRDMTASWVRQRAGVKRDKPNSRGSSGGRDGDRNRGGANANAAANGGDADGDGDGDGGGGGGGGGGAGGGAQVAANIELCQFYEEYDANGR